MNRRYKTEICDVQISFLQVIEDQERVSDAEHERRRGGRRRKR